MRKTIAKRCSSAALFINSFCPMERLRHILIILSCFFLAIGVEAKKWTPETLPIPYLQDNRQYVSNPDSVLDRQVVDSINAILKRLEKDKGIQTVVVAVKSIEGDDAYDFCMQLGRKYGIGSKESTGLIVFLATEDRTYQFLTGNGLEGTLPDAACRRIQNRVMIPLLKKGEWAKAMQETIVAVDAYIRKDPTIGNNANDNDDDSAGAAAVGFLFGFIFFLAFLVWFSSRRPKCPKCKKGRMEVISRDRVKVNGSKGYWWKTVMRCPKCGYEKTDLRKDDTNSGSHSGSVVPPVFFGGGGSRGGGGFTGGSFGGGSFGGGGSGGSF